MVESDAVEMNICAAEGTPEGDFNGEEALLAGRVVVGTDEEGFVVGVVVGSVADVAVALEGEGRRVRGR